MQEQGTSGGAARVGGLIAGASARVKLEKKRAAAAYPPPGKPLEGISPGEWQLQGYVDETGFLPQNCPVRPLGYDGENFYFVDTMGQVFNTGDSALGVERLQKLFAGHEDFLYWAWPAKDVKKMFADPGFKSERVRRDLFAACRARGAWTMSDTVRGRGAWRDDQGNLLLHCGDAMWIDGQLEDTGEYDGYFYPRRPRSFEPWAEPVKQEDNPATQLFEILRTWNFARGDIDVMFLVGWIGVAMLGGALEWRPSVFLVGDAGTGKSELFGKNGLIRSVLGRMMVATTNATEAGLYQLVGHDSVPIAIDELEGEDGQDQAQKVIKMARDAASGSVRIRGGQNHKGVEFQAQSSFAFSGINPPPIPPANLTRLVIIEMMPLKVTSNKAPVLSAAETVGPRLLRILADGWQDLEYKLDQYYAILREAGHNSRGQKTFGTFLALAHTLIGDDGLKKLGLPCEANSDTYKWAEWLKPDALPELEGGGETWRQAIEFILTSEIQAYAGGVRKTVAEVIEDLRDGRGDSSHEVAFNDTRTMLGHADLGLLSAGKAGYILAVPLSSKKLGRALMDTPFGDPGGNGSWKWALRRAPPQIVSRDIDAGGAPDNRIRIAGRRTRCLFIHLRQFEAST
ncbi:hypothetical protein FJU08_01315 [Martelella alba]|uniref:DNA primase/helicase n=1 Tax=Martelella alba TaxID=2590451 RepID=A0A506UIV4_9HYPH|nr:hypothetical protein [Martelella alba]TPW33232.1 hypothetical protein FJU08_01315 [Martelella alba]